MRTTIRLDDQLLREVKSYAARTDQTLTSVIEDALREMLSRRQEATGRTAVKLLTVSGEGPMPGVDLDDTSLLLDLMAEVHAPV